jgi:hypothetical protein
MTIKRYDRVSRYGFGTSWEEMKEDEAGDWVRYEDIEALLPQPCADHPTAAMDWACHACLETQLVKEKPMEQVKPDNPPCPIHHQVMLETTYGYYCAECDQNDAPCEEVQWRDIEAQLAEIERHDPGFIEAAKAYFTTRADAPCWSDGSTGPEPKPRAPGPADPPDYPHKVKEVG